MLLKLLQKKTIIKRNSTLIRSINSYKTIAPNWDDRVKESFSLPTFMTTIGAKITHIKPGEIDIEIDTNSSLCQQHGFFHAGVTTSIADTAAGYAAYTLFPTNSDVLTTEIKINLLNPAVGDKLIAKGRIIKYGKTLSICGADVYSIIQKDNQVIESHVATGLFSLMCMKNKK
jgi:uncharacterized protein (TIGR00369 family)